MAYVVNRSFAHRAHGAIGQTELSLDDKGVMKLDGKILPDSSVEYLLGFALQSLQDAYAGAKDLAEAQGAFEGKRDKLLAGTIGVRGGGGGVDEMTRVARMLVRKAFMATAPDDAKAAFKALDDAAKNAKLDEWFEANREAMQPAVEEEVARREEARKAKAGLARKVSFEL